MQHPKRHSHFLPTSRKEMLALGWDQPDVILFSGDAYIDHPSFGASIIGRVLEREGLRVAIVPQPNWRDDLRDFTKLGAPRLFFAVTSGNMDSMVNHYTANKRLRSDDAYTPEGRAGYRPDYALKVYSQIVRKLFPETPIVIGGIEASLRRFTHFDYWDNKLHPSILTDTNANLLVYGMGERPIAEVARRLSKGESIGGLTDIPQTAHIAPSAEAYASDSKYIRLHSLNECLNKPALFGENFIAIEKESNRMDSQPLVEPFHGGAVVVNPPYPPASQTEIDSWWALPYQFAPHPRYKGKHIPAWEMIKHSINIHRGCFGGCSFCAISAHQGRFISSRSKRSILKEVDTIVNNPDFKGTITDLGGPSANMYMMRGADQNLCRECKRPSCVYPSICANMNISHKPLLELYRTVRERRGVKRVFIGSGIRYDLFSNPVDSHTHKYLEEVMVNHVSGRLKVAPEHSEPEVLKQMRKPPFKLFEQLKREFDRLNQKHSLRLQLTPYLMSSHPGCSNAQMLSLKTKVDALGLKPEQVQDFTPTPMTLSSVIYYTGINPYTRQKVFVEQGKMHKVNQKEVFLGPQGVHRKRR